MKKALQQNVEKTIKYLQNRNYRFLVNAQLGLCRKMSDVAYLKRMFFAHIEMPLNLENPKTFNEKLQWLKLYDRKPEYTIMVDKYLVRQYIAKKIGAQYLIPLLGIWDSPDEIDFDKLPNQFVLKCNHNSGGLCICRDKNSFDIQQAKHKLRKSMKTNYYLKAREWPYKNVPRKIIAEKYMEDESGYELRDYKIHNFNGTPKFILHSQNRFSKTGLTEDYFSTEWEHLDIKWPDYPCADTLPKRPSELEEMLHLSRILSKNIPFVRTDFYIVNGKIYFGEMTFYPAAGLEKFYPKNWDYILGEWLTLPERCN